MNRRVPPHDGPNCAFCWERIHRMADGLEELIDPTLVLKQCQAQAQSLTDVLAIRERLALIDRLLKALKSRSHEDAFLTTVALDHLVKEVGWINKLAQPRRQGRSKAVVPHPLAWSFSRRGNSGAIPFDG